MEAAETGSREAGLVARLLLGLRSILISAPLILLATAFFGAVALLLPASSRGGRLHTALRRWWARIVLAASFTRLEVRGLGRLQAGHPYVFCANHASYLDPPALLAALPFPVRFLAKRPLFSIPFLGWAMRRDGDIPVERERAHTAARSLTRASESVRKGISIVVFPEGGRSMDGRLQHFRRGGAHLAIAAGAPVVPIAITGSGKALRPGSIYLPGGKIVVALGAPISVSGLAPEASRALIEEIERAVRELMGGA